MKSNLFRKMLATTISVATISSCLPFGAHAKTTDGTITIVDPGRLENIGECISGEKLQSANIVETVWEGAKSGGKYYEVKTGTETDYSLGLEGGDITTYPILKADLGKDFWTEENKDKYIVVTLSAVDGGFDYLSLVGNDNLEITTMGSVITWQLNGHDGSRFNTTYIVYKPSEVRKVDDHLEGAHYSVYHNGVKTDITSGCWIDEYNQYPTKIGLKLGAWNAGAKTIHMNRFGVYVTDDPMSIINDYDLISDQTGGTHAWVPESNGGTKQTETGYLGKAADDVSTQTTTPYFADEYNCEVRQTLKMPEQDANSDGTADWYIGNADKRYLVFGAQMVSNNWVYVGLRADNEWFTPALGMWDYCLPDQWNQIYVVYDRYSEEGAGQNRGKTYIYVNGVKVMDGLQRGGAWDKLAKSMDKISFFASNHAIGEGIDVHWDNVEMYMTDEFPDIEEAMPSLSATATQTIEHWNVKLSSACTPADLVYDGDKVRVYRGGKVGSLLDDDEYIAVGDKISVDKGNQVRQYTVTEAEVPAPKVMTNVMAYVPSAGNGAVLSWINPEYVIEDVKVYLNDDEQNVEVNTAAKAFNEIYFDGLTVGQEYSFKVTASISGETVEYTDSVTVTGARNASVAGIGSLRSASWMRWATDSNGKYANTVFEIKNDDTHGNYVKMTGNIPQIQPGVYAGIGQTISLDNDSDYIIKFKAKGEGCDHIKLMVNPESMESYEFSNTTNFEITDEWEEYSYIISPATISEGTQTNVSLMLYNETDFTGTVYIDDVEVYYYDSEEGALTEFGNQMRQSDFEPVPAVLNDPTYTIENGMVNVNVDVENVTDLEFMVALYKDNVFEKVSRVSKTNIVSDTIEIGLAYEGDWTANKYTAKVFYWDSLESLKPLRNAFNIK